MLLLLLVAVVVAVVVVVMITITTMLLCYNISHACQLIISILFWISSGFASVVLADILTRWAETCGLMMISVSDNSYI